MKIRECTRGQIYHIGFIDCNYVNEYTVKNSPSDTVENLEEGLLYFVNRLQILFPYNFE
jgi:hypothetical protein